MKLVSLMKNIVKYQGSASKLARQRGTTLIELSVVIAVILLLVGVLFIGVTAWKEGANRAACIVNLSSIQKAVRGYQNMNEKNVGDACVAATDLIGATGFFPARAAGLPIDRGCLYPIGGHSGRRDCLRHLRGCRSRANGGKPGQLVKLARLLGFHLQH